MAMADDNQPPAPGTPPEATPPTPPAPPPPAPPAPPTPPTPPADQYGNLGVILKPIGDGINAVLNAVAGLPETVANAVREASQPAKPTPPEGEGTGTGEGTGETKGKRNRFVEYWFTH